MYAFAKYKAEPEVEKNYHVNINDLFDSDDPFLWENPHFCALIRRIHTHQPHLINPSFDIDEDILKPNPALDCAWSDFDKRNKYYYRSPSFQMLHEQLQLTFNLGGSLGQNAFEKTIGNYERFFHEKQQELNHRLELIQQGKSFW